MSATLRPSSATVNPTSYTETSMSNILQWKKPAPIVETMVIHTVKGGIEQVPVGTAIAVAAGKVPISKMDVSTLKNIIFTCLKERGLTV
jgi:hypothetical protein